MKRITWTLSAIALIAASCGDRTTFDPSFEREFIVDFADWTPDSVTVEGSTQGMAMYENYCVVLHHGGQCCIFDMKEQKLWASYMLEGNETHCNNAFFGKERLTKDSAFPLLYISECQWDHACLVTDLSRDGGKIVQKIFYDNESGAYPKNFDWAQDLSGDYIYTYGGLNGSFKMLRKFRLPKLADSDENGEVHLKDADVLDETRLEEGVNIWQGSLVNGRYAFLTDGRPDEEDEYLHLVDLQEKRITKSVSVMDTTLEPEGVDIAGDWLYVIFHTPKTPRHSTLYRFSLKPAP